MDGSDADPKIHVPPLTGWADGLAAVEGDAAADVDGHEPVGPTGQRREVDLGSASDPSTLDAILIQDGESSESPSRYETLIELKAATTSDLVPDFAKSWDVSADGLTYTFHLQPASTSPTGPISTRMQRSTTSFAGRTCHPAPGR